MRLVPNPHLGHSRSKQGSALVVDGSVAIATSRVWRTGGVTASTTTSWTMPLWQQYGLMSTLWPASPMRDTRTSPSAAPLTTTREPEPGMKRVLGSASGGRCEVRRTATCWAC